MVVWMLCADAVCSAHCTHCTHCTHYSQNSLIIPVGRSWNIVHEIGLRCAPNTLLFIRQKFLYEQQQPNDWVLYFLSAFKREKCSSVKKNPCSVDMGIGQCIARRKIKRKKEKRNKERDRKLNSHYKTLL